MGKRRGRRAYTLEDKVNKVDEHYVEEIRSSSPDKIKEKLLNLSKYENELEQAKKDDVDLAQKRDALKVANQTYSEPLAAIKIKRAFAFQVLAEKGQA